MKLKEYSAYCKQCRKHGKVPLGYSELDDTRLYCPDCGSVCLLNHKSLEQVKKELRLSETEILNNPIKLI